MNHLHTGASPFPALAFLAVLAAVGAWTVVGLRRPSMRLLVIAGMSGVVFQFAHLAEHVAQVGYWVLHPGQAPWMTPWASALADSFGSLAPGTPAFGMEAMHLTGNAIFLGGAVAVVGLLSSYGLAAGRRLGRAAVVVQSIHVLEHVALTVSVVVTGRAIGVSTLLGTADPGPGLWTYRVWWHMAINAAATTLLALAVARSLRDRPISTAGARSLAVLAGQRP